MSAPFVDLWHSPRDRKLVGRWARTGTRHEIKEKEREREDEKKGERGRGKNGRRKKNYRADRNTHMQKARRVAAGEAEARVSIYLERCAFVALLKDSKRPRHARKY